MRLNDLAKLTRSRKIKRGNSAVTFAEEHSVSLDSCHAAPANSQHIAPKKLTRALLDLRFLVTVIALASMTLGVAPAMANAAIQPLHSVTFHENVTVSDAMITYQVNNVATPLTLFESLAPTFANPGSTFESWNTSAFGNGIRYADGAIYDFASGPLDLYAQWKPNSITFYENRSGLDTVNFIENGTAAGTLTAFANVIPAFSNVGFSFAGWNTNAGGTGTSYANGAPYDFTLGSLVLFALWHAIPADTANFSPVGASGSVAPMSGTDGTSITLPSAVGLSYAGFAFVSWNTSANGSGTAHAPGSNYTLTGDVTFYAQWVPNTATFFENASPGDVVQVIQSSSVVAPLTAFASLSIPFVRPGYTFVGWTTSPDGTGAFYADGASFNFLLGSAALYAKWAVIPTIIVSLQANGGSGPSTFLSGAKGSTVTLPGSNLFTYSGRTFDGWNSSASGGGTSYAGGSLVTLTSDVTLYAQWATNNLTVTFNPGAGSVSPTSASYAAGGASLILPTPVLAGYIFDGWFTSSSGGTLVGVAGVGYAPGGDVTLFAQWHSIPTYTVTFDPNGGTGVIAPITGASGVTVTLPGVTGLSHPGYTLLRWSTVRNGSGTSYTCGTTMVLAASTTLFAQWSGRKPAVALAAVGPFNARSSSLSVAHKRQIAKLASVIKARHFKTILLYGYAANTGLVSLNMSISRARAAHVAAYLRGRLAALHVRVVVKSAGEGSLIGAASAANRRVEVFAQ